MESETKNKRVKSKTKLTFKILTILLATYMMPSVLKNKDNPIQITKAMLKEGYIDQGSMSGSQRTKKSQIDDLDINQINNDDYIQNIQMSNQGNNYPIYQPGQSRRSIPSQQGDGNNYYPNYNYDISQPQMQSQNQNPNQQYIMLENINYPIVQKQNSAPGKSNPNLILNLMERLYVADEGENIPGNIDMFINTFYNYVWNTYTSFSDKDNKLDDADNFTLMVDLFRSYIENLSDYISDMIRGAITDARDERLPNTEENNIFKLLDRINFNVIAEIAKGNMYEIVSWGDGATENVVGNFFTCAADTLTSTNEIINKSCYFLMDLLSQMINSGNQNLLYRGDFKGLLNNLAGLVVLYNHLSFFVGSMMKGIYQFYLECWRQQEYNDDSKYGILTNAIGQLNNLFAEGFIINDLNFNLINSLNDNSNLPKFIVDLNQNMQNVTQRCAWMNQEVFPELKRISCDIKPFMNNGDIKQPSQSDFSFKMSSNPNNPNINYNPQPISQQIRSNDYNPQSTFQQMIPNVPRTGNSELIQQQINELCTMIDNQISEIGTRKGHLELSLKTYVYTVKKVHTTDQENDIKKGLIEQVNTRINEIFEIIQNFVNIYGKIIKLHNFIQNSQLYDNVRNRYEEQFQQDIFGFVAKIFNDYDEIMQTINDYSKADQSLKEGIHQDYTRLKSLYDGDFTKFKKHFNKTYSAGYAFNEVEYIIDYLNTNRDAIKKIALSYKNDKAYTTFVYHILALLEGISDSLNPPKYTKELLDKYIIRLNNIIEAMNIAEGFILEQGKGEYFNNRLKEINILRLQANKLKKDIEEIIITTPYKELNQHIKYTQPYKNNVRTMEMDELVTQNQTGELVPIDVNKPEELERLDNLPFYELTNIEDPNLLLYAAKTISQNMQVIGDICDAELQKYDEEKKEIQTEINKQTAVSNQMHNDGIVDILDIFEWKGDKENWTDMQKINLIIQEDLLKDEDRANEKQQILAYKKVLDDIENMYLRMDELDQRGKTWVTLKNIIQQKYSENLETLKDEQGFEKQISYQKNLFQANKVKIEGEIQKLQKSINQLEELKGKNPNNDELININNQLRQYNNMLVERQKSMEKDLNESSNKIKVLEKLHNFNKEMAEDMKLHNQKVLAIKGLQFMANEDRKQKKNDLLKKRRIIKGYNERREDEKEANKKQFREKFMHRNGLTVVPLLNYQKMFGDGFKSFGGEQFKDQIDFEKLDPLHDVYDTIEYKPIVKANNIISSNPYYGYERQKYIQNKEFLNDIREKKNQLRKLQKDFDRKNSHKFNENKNIMKKIVDNEGNLNKIRDSIFKKSDQKFELLLKNKQQGLIRHKQNGPYFFDLLNLFKDSNNKWNINFSLVSKRTGKIYRAWPDQIVTTLSDNKLYEEGWELLDTTKNDIKKRIKDEKKNLEQKQQQLNSRIEQMKNDAEELQNKFITIKKDVDYQRKNIHEKASLNKKLKDEYKDKKFKQMDKLKDYNKQLQENKEEIERNVKDFINANIIDIKYLKKDQELLKNEIKLWTDLLKDQTHTDIEIQKLIEIRKDQINAKLGIISEKQKENSKKNKLKQKEKDEAKQKLNKFIKERDKKIISSLSRYRDKSNLQNELEDTEEVLKDRENSLVFEKAKVKTFKDIYEQYKNGKKPEDIIKEINKNSSIRKIDKNMEKLKRKIETNKWENDFVNFYGTIKSEEIDNILQTKQRSAAKKRSENVFTKYMQEGKKFETNKSINLPGINDIDIQIANLEEGMAKETQKGIMADIEKIKNDYNDYIQALKVKEDQKKKEKQIKKKVEEEYKENEENQNLEFVKADKKIYELFKRPNIEESESNESESSRGRIEIRPKKYYGGSSGGSYNNPYSSSNSPFTGYISVIQEEKNIEEENDPNMGMGMGEK